LLLVPARVNDHRLTAGGFGLRLKAGLIGPAADMRAISQRTFCVSP
jgi:hypothetical protein